MKYRKLEKKMLCPTEYALEIFGGKWKVPCICMISHLGPVRYGDLKHGLKDISDPVLASVLKELRAAEIVQRIQYNEIPPKVEYLLTEKGTSLLPILQQICGWVTEHNDTDKWKKQILPCTVCRHTDSGI